LWALHLIDRLQFPYLSVPPIEAKTMDEPQIKVAVIDDSAKFRKQLVKFLEKEPDILVVAEAGTDPAGIMEVEEHKPDVILMDKNNPFTEGLDATSMIVSKFPDTRIIVLSMASRDSLTASKCQTWACYSLCENCSAKEILAAIRESYQPKDSSVPRRMGQSNSINQ
jgi:DNA-binding NarL/FixJ family response regulator